MSYKKKDAIPFRPHYRLPLPSLVSVYDGVMFQLREHIESNNKRIFDFEVLVYRHD